MEARFTRVVFRSTLLVGLSLFGVGSLAEAAGYKTTNFTVSAPTPQLAKEIGDQAEVYRRQLAMEWLGKELPTWSKACPITADVSPNKGAGGATSFVFDRGEVYNWKMKIQGSRERILDSVLPHEITHTIFASYFRQPLPRWADEGACTTVEHRSEIAKQERNLIQYLKTGRGIEFGELFGMKDYPQDVMPLYAQGHSISEWLIESRGRQEFLEFLADGMKDENWPRAVHEHYGFDNLPMMQNQWNDWVKQGRPRIVQSTGPVGQLAANTRSVNGAVSTPATAASLRLQSPDNISPVGATATKPPAQPASANTAVTVAPPGSSVYVVSSGPTRGTRGALQPLPPPDSSMAATTASVYAGSTNAPPIRR